MAAALQAQEIMQLLPCTGKPVAAAILQARKLCNCCPARENLWWLQYKRSKLCSCFHMQQSLWLLLGKFYNCCHARENLWLLQYKRGKLCNWCHARQKLRRFQAREYTQTADANMQPVSRVGSALFP